MSLRILPTLFLSLTVLSLGIALLFPLVVYCQTNKKRQSSMKNNNFGFSLAVEAAALSTTASRTSQQQRPVRVFCFGDSLTAGTSPPDFQNFPYCPHLEAALRPKFPEIAARHLGYPGWTSSQLLEDAKGGGGLRTVIRKIRDPSLSLVILLAGTNDLGYVTAQQQSLDDVAESVTALHKLCYEENVPHTIAIGIPPSAYQSFHPEAAEAAKSVNQQLQAFCDDDDSSSKKATFFPFPFGWAPGDDRWSSDGLHFSARGYQVLGESLAPVVEKILATSTGTG